MLDNIPKPFLFNAIKHHAGYIQSTISHWQEHNFQERQSTKELLKIGNRKLDLYVGELTVAEIVNEVRQQLISTNHFECDAYVQYLSANEKSYRTIQLSDDSEWILLHGIERERYIHLHPGRHTNNTIRIKALSLKTAMILRFMNARIPESQDFVKLINQVRQEFLDESPIKSLSCSKGVAKILECI